MISVAAVSATIMRRDGGTPASLAVVRLKYSAAHPMAGKRIVCISAPMITMVTGADHRT